MVDSLTTEVATPDVSPKVAEAERTAHRAIRDLAETLHGRFGRFTGMEWKYAGRAVEYWIEVSS